MSSPAPRVLVIAKAPEPGRTKTRLVPPLTGDQAAGLQRALLLDTLDACRREVDDVAILHADPAEAPAFERLAPGTPLVLQSGRGLEDALARTFDRYAAAGPVAIVSADVPGLPHGSLARTFAALEGGADVVLGPAHDGGYWLIAMAQHHEEPFREIPWSTPAVLGVTLARCREAGLRVELLDAWRDLDTVVDLAFVRRNSAELDAPRTVPTLAALELPDPPALELEASELLAGSPWRAVLSDHLRGPDGRETGYSYLAVPRAVFVVAVTPDEELLLVRQYRHPVRDWTLEVPAGSVHDGETPQEAAARELAEETGGSARAWRHLTTFYSSSAHLSLRSDAFLATGVDVGTAAPDHDEHLELVRLPLADALERARAGGFHEGQTALAILLAAPHLNGEARR
ncbi:MAG TPA: TIGR04282 family arsenosugar biosynthesis glycosyltransferase [Gaiellaceae bacterium]